jgi:hypothetical protein
MIEAYQEDDGGELGMLLMEEKALQKQLPRKVFHKGVGLLSTNI